VSWLGNSVDGILPTVVEGDAIPLLFGDVDRSEIQERVEEGEAGTVARPRRNASMPARYLNRIYAVPLIANAATLRNEWKGECTDIIKLIVSVDGDNRCDNVFCNCYFSRMTKTTVTVDAAKVIYECFRCKQADKKKSYSRPRDMICHSVANHGEFPHGVRLNKLYLSDGTDLRPATEDEILSYGDDSHKAKKKPAEAVDDPRPATAPHRVESYAEVAKKIVRKPRGEATKKASDKGIEVDEEMREMIELGRRTKAKQIAEEIMRAGAARRGSGASKEDGDDPEFSPPVLIPEVAVKRRVPRMGVATKSVPPARRVTEIKTSKKGEIPTTVAAHDLDLEPDSEKEGDDNDAQSLRSLGASGVHIGLPSDVTDIPVPPPADCSVQISAADVAATVQMKVALADVASKHGVPLPIVNQAAVVIVTKAQTALSALREAMDYAAATRKLDEDNAALVLSVVSPPSGVVASGQEGVPSTSGQASISGAIQGTRGVPTRTLAELAAAFYATAAGGKEPPKKPKRMAVASTSSVVVPTASASATLTIGAPKISKGKTIEGESGSATRPMSAPFDDDTCLGLTSPADPNRRSKPVIVEEKETERPTVVDSDSESSSSSSSDSSDGSSSARSAGSRKRPAEGSPEREPLRASERGRGGVVGPRTEAGNEGGELGGGDAAPRGPGVRAARGSVGGGEPRSVGASSTAIATARNVVVSPTEIATTRGVVASSTAIAPARSVVASPTAVASTSRSVGASTNAIVINPDTPRAHVQEEMGHDARVIDGLYQMIVAFPPPWNTMTLLEAAVQRFPDVERVALRMTVAAIVISLRRGANEILFASLRRGPRRDEYGELLVDLDLKEINKFNSST